MKILLQTVNLELDKKARTEMEWRLREAFVPMAHRILRVKVRIQDQNGPRGGHDISCCIDVRLCPRGRLFILETDLDPLGAVSKAREAAVTAVRRMLERSRDAIRRASPRSLSAALEKCRRVDESLA
jgi:putative sigma-54 modulation protein